jgi:glycosyltransferase involved in cell wall biosynthesis
VTKLSILVPCFNENKTITQLLDRVRAVPMPEGVTREIIVVDDGSSDGSGEALKTYAARHDDIQLHISVINLGKGTALRIGIHLATGDIIAIQDADLELCPEEIPMLIEPILAGQTNVVFGSRFLGQRKYPFTLSLLANKILSWLTRLLYNATITDMETCYKIFRRDVLAGVRLRSAGFEIEPELTGKFLRLGNKVVERPITYHPRTNAEGKKIRAWDGFKAVYYLIKYRVIAREKLLVKTPAPGHAAAAGQSAELAVR